MRVYFGILALCAACSGPPQAPSIDASKAKAFVAYQDKLIPLERKWAKAEGPVPVIDELTALRAATDLTEKEVAALNEIGALITVRDDALKQRLDKQIAEEQQAVERAPQMMRSAAQQSAENLQRMRANVFELAEMRQKYGDPIVDAMQQQEPELKRQRLELASIH